MLIRTRSVNPLLQRRERSPSLTGAVSIVMPFECTRNARETVHARNAITGRLRFCHGYSSRNCTVQRPRVEVSSPSLPSEPTSSSSPPPARPRCSLAVISRGILPTRQRTFRGHATASPLPRPPPTVLSSLPPPQRERERDLRIRIRLCACPCTPATRQKLSDVPARINRNAETDKEKAVNLERRANLDNRCIVPRVDLHETARHCFREHPEMLELSLSPDLRVSDRIELPRRNVDRIYGISDVLLCYLFIYFFSGCTWTHLLANVFIVMTQLAEKSRQRFLHGHDSLSAVTLIEN